jgi:acyl dehydratase
MTPPLPTPTPSERREPASDPASAQAPPTTVGLRLPRETLGTTAGPLEGTIDARWLMAYAGALGETDPRYFDTTGGPGPAAHPLFPVCYEWPVAVALRDRAIGPAISPFSVHATHDLVIHRPPRAGDRLSTTARIVEVRPVKAGSLVIGRYDTVDAEGAPVTSTHYGSIYRGVMCNQAEIDRLGGPFGSPQTPSLTSRPGSAGAVLETDPVPSRAPVLETAALSGLSGALWQQDVTVGAQLAHVYTECARIWNPIHTDIAVARAAGLPGLILHGTATLALAVSQVVARELGGDPGLVRGVAARFTGMVPMPSVVTVRGYESETGDVHFDVVDAAGRPVLGRGVVKR